LANVRNASATPRSFRSPRRRRSPPRR
jgi:hypothetical protein